MAGRKQETQLRTAGGIRYELTRKKVKNLNIRVREDGTVAVSVPLRTSAEAADRFVAERAEMGAGGPGTCPAACRPGRTAPAGQGDRAGVLYGHER